jgi:hypothetical protein
MIFLLINAPEDQLLAYQHQKRSNFVTRKHVDKLFGARELAKRLNIDLENSLGAGDTEMDNFLGGVGCAVHVGSLELDFKGIHSTLRLKSSHDFGDLLFDIADRLSERKYDKCG